VTPVPVPVPPHSSSRTPQAKKDKQAKKEYLKQMSELEKIVQQQRLENKKLEKPFSNSKRQSLRLSLALSQQQESPPANPWDKFVASEVTGSHYAVARGKWFSSFGIYADMNKFLLEVNGVVVSLFKVCESYSEAHLYLREHFVKEKEDPVPQLVAPTDSPPSRPEGGISSRPVPPEEKRSNLFKAGMLDLGGRGVTGDQSKGKEGKLFGYSVLDTVKLRNCLFPDPNHLPDIMKKHFTEQMADVVACTWSEGQGGDLDGEHSDFLTRALTTLLGKENDEAFGGNTMDTQCKQVKRITLSSIKTLEDLTTRLEYLRDGETTLSETVGINLESVMLKAGYDEDIAKEWYPISHLYIISLLGFQYYVGFYTHLWKVSTTYSWYHAELQMEQHVKETRQIHQSHGTRLPVVSLTYIYLWDQRDKGFRSYKIEDKINNELHSELETQGNLLETMRA
jgi:hypothetical protein